MLTFKPNRAVYLCGLKKGSHVECQYALMTFGIPQAALPISDNGDIALGCLEHFLDRRKQIEDELIGSHLDQQHPSELIEYPQSADVVLGRGRPYQGMFRIVDCSIHRLNRVQI